MLSCAEARGPKGPHTCRAYSRIDELYSILNLNQFACQHATRLVFESGYAYSTPSFVIMLTEEHLQSDYYTVGAQRPAVWRRQVLCTHSRTLQQSSNCARPIDSAEVLRRAVCVYRTMHNAPLSFDCVKPRVSRECKVGCGCAPLQREAL